MTQPPSPAGQDPEPDEEHIEAMDRLARTGGRTQRPAASGPRRPRTIIIAAVMSWLGSLALLFGGVTILASRQQLLAGLEDLGQDAASAINGIGGFLLGTGLVVAALTVLTFRGAKWAVWLLAGVGFVFILFCMIGVLTGAMAMLLPILWTVAAVVLYLLPASGDWFRRRERY